MCNAMSLQTKQQVMKRAMSMCSTINLGVHGKAPCWVPWFIEGYQVPVVGTHHGNGGGSFSLRLRVHGYLDMGGIF